MANQAGRWALAIFVSLLLAGGTAWGFEEFGVLSPPPLGIRGWIAMGVATSILAGKMSLKGVLKQEFKLNEQGQESSLLALGAAVPAAADYLFLGAPHKWRWLIFAFVAVLATFFSVLCSVAAVDNSSSRGQKALWTSASMVLGAGSFFFYMLLVVLKSKV